MSLTITFLLCRIKTSHMFITDQWVLEKNFKTYFLVLMLAVLKCGRQAKRDRQKQVIE